MTNNLFENNDILGDQASSKEERDISSQANGINTTFTVPAFKEESIEVYYNGIKQRLTNEFTIVNNVTIQTTFTPKGSPSVLVVAYYPT